MQDLLSAILAPKMRRMNFAGMQAFLEDLEAHNDRTWMATAQERYKEVQATWLSTTEALIEQLAVWDPRLIGLEARKCVFRLHRDVRFSPNKLPYKTNLGAFIAPRGKKGGLAGYYLHLAPKGHSFLGGGVYHPETATLRTLRQAIDEDGDALQKIVSTPAFTHYFGGLGGARLQRVPRGYSQEHPCGELLKHKDFLVRKPLEDTLFVTEDPLQSVMEGFALMRPLNEWLNDALTVEA